MRTKTGFNLRTVCGENMILAEGQENIDFSSIINLNESAAYLWNNIQGKDFTVEQLADLLTEEYEVDRDTALRDASSLAADWIMAGIVEQ